MMGRVLIVVLLLSAIFAGGAMYYLQVYGFYEEVAASGEGDVMLTSVATGAPEAIAYDGFEAIDADSSPIRYRACFETEMSAAMLTESYVVYDDAVPLVAPGWFDCFDARAVGEALEEGRATAFLGTENIKYGIDRVVAITEGGQGYVWHQINRCGEEVFDGNAAPEGCPEPPERTE